ncbi:unnamed protein product [Brassicogethes aeneus]|uniref:RRM domain-containing protein n=1 Tax=Brassicogethes aeneus TaxID=1431903 RepID=A0A9P0AZK4_BRAAE|nr:unnamed protein product [Brassicogethes aeneus]
MKLQEKRIFISDLPETATEDECKTLFGEYGKVKSIEIKERKELGPKNYSLFFAYINLETDDHSIQKCFKDFAQNEWHGQYVQLQLARESFLDRLKREREENEKNNGNATSQPKLEPLQPKIINGVKKTPKKESSSESSSETESEDEKPPVKKTSAITKPVSTKSSSSSSSSSSESEKEIEPPITDFVIKSNKGKQLNKNGLVIESVGNEPIIKIDLSKKKPATVNSEANLKRLQSLNRMKEGYKSQKLTINKALAKVDATQDNKVVFSGKSSEKKDKKSLFDDEESDGENFEDNFKVKEQFQGKKGQKLLELQSKFKNDKRFALDERFVEEDDEQVMTENRDLEDLTLEEEKQKELEILGEVLGKNLPAKSKLNEEKQMLRFDPTQPEHSKYEMQKEVAPPKSKKKRRDFEEAFADKKVEESKQPEVSKEVFYKVTENLKETLHGEKPGFSLLGMFGKNEDVEENGEETAEKIIRGNNNNLGGDKNPFKYDSSDDEDQTEDIPNASNQEQKDVPDTRNVRFWSESFFFKDDDYRLQEGFDFIEKMRLEEKGEFTKLRRDLKEIVRSKVRNNQRKDKPFRKKLGGNKKRKNIRMKKALKR